MPTSRSPRRWIHSSLIGLAAGVLAAGAAAAQSNLSTQGYGFPPGQLSSHALGTGGAIGEMDPLSPVNPASIAAFATRVLFFQIEPEYRSVTTANGTERTTTARYPDIFGALPFHGFVATIGSSTLLDRTATTTFNTTQFLPNGDSVPQSTTYRVDGAMNDVRLGLGWAPRTWLRLGVGAHAIVGHNLVSLTQSFTDSVTFSAFTQSRVLGFSGGAASAGFQLVSSSWELAASGRHGWDMNVNVEDTVLAHAKVPDRWGVSLAYLGFANSAIAVRTAHDSWSSLGGLGSAQSSPVDTWDTSVGADIAGPKFGSHVVFLRGGFRDRTLPFQASGHTVTEKSGSGGIGSVFAAGHVIADLSVIRASRTAALAASEKAWTISIGLAIRP